MRILGNGLPFVAHANKLMTGLTMPDDQKIRSLGNKSYNENSRLKSGSSYTTTFFLTHVLFVEKTTLLS